MLRNFDRTKIEPTPSSSKFHNHFVYVHFELIIFTIFPFDRQVLGAQSPSLDNLETIGSTTWRRRRPDILRSPALKMSEDGFTDGDDDILDSLVKTATRAPNPRTTPRERKRTRNADRKSCKLKIRHFFSSFEKFIYFLLFFVHCEKLNSKTIANSRRFHRRTDNGVARIGLKIYEMKKK